MVLRITPSQLLSRLEKSASFPHTASKSSFRKLYNSDVLGWLGFIGKLFQFCLEKVIGKKIDLAQDQRKRSATAFLRLYNSLQSLENLCATFLHIARPVVVGERKRLRNESFRVLSEEADRASEEFLASAKDLIGALQIFDPTLALMLGQVQHGKFTFLATSSGFEKILSPLDSRANDRGVLEQVTYTGPSSDLEAIDFEGLYQTIEGCGDGPWQRDWYPELISGELVIKRVPTEWPKDSLLNLLEGRIVDHVLLPTDIEQIKALSDLTERHLAVLSEARKQLGAFIASHFSIEDLLYVREIPGGGVF